MSVAIQMKAIKQYSPVVLFITLYEAFLTFKAVDHKRWSFKSYKRCLPDFPKYGTVCYFAVQRVFEMKF